MAGPRYVVKPVGGGWWCVFDATKGIEVSRPQDQGDPFMEKRDAVAFAAERNAAP
jgi:hypothetical protein